MKPRPHKRGHSQVKIATAYENDPGQHAFLPTLILDRVYPKTTWVVPAVKTPLYWFDMLMVRKRLIIAITRDTFIAGGKRFKVLAQDHKIIGVGFTRWLVYEEDAVLKGQKP